MMKMCDLCKERISEHALEVCDVCHNDFILPVEEEQDSEDDDE